MFPRLMSVVVFTLNFMIIDCDTCLLRDIACRDCVVSVLLGSPDSPDLLATISEPEERVIALLSSRGMVPPLRFSVNQSTEIGQ